MVTRIRLNFKACTHCLSCFQKKATVFHNPQIWSFSTSTSISTFFVQWRTKSRKSLLYKLRLLVACNFLGTSVLGSALHLIKSNMRDWEVLTPVLLTFKAFWDNRSFRFVIIYGLSEKFYSHRSVRSYSQKHSTAELPKIIELSSQMNLNLMDIYRMCVVRKCFGEFCVDIAHT